MAGQQTRGRRTAAADPGGGGAVTAGDKARMKAHARAGEGRIAAAYEAGRTGGTRPTDPELAGYYDDGTRDAGRERRRQRVSDLSGAAPVRRAGALANDGAGFGLGLLGYALLVNYLRGGAGGARAWLAAKFLNRTAGPSAIPSRPPAPAAPSTPRAAP